MEKDALGFPFTPVLRTGRRSAYTFFQEIYESYIVHRYLADGGVWGLFGRPRASSTAKFRRPHKNSHCLVGH